MSLRDELGAPAATPDFEIDLPQGWARHAADDASLESMLAVAKRRCMETHNLQLFSEIKTQLERSFADMRKGGVIAYFCPTDLGDTTVAVPASINASIRNGEAGQSLDDVARGLIRSRGAKPLLGDPRTLRFETEKLTRLGDETVINHSAVYLTPIPGTGRRRALALVAGFARTPDISADDESMEAMRFMFDACVSTLRWSTPHKN